MSKEQNMNTESSQNKRPWLYDTDDRKYIAEVLRCFDQLDSPKFETLLLKAISSGESGPFGKAEDPLFLLLYNISNNDFSEDGKLGQTQDKITTLIEVLSTHSDKVSNLSKNQAFFMLESCVDPEIFKSAFGEGGVLKPEPLDKETYAKHRGKLHLAFKIKRVKQAFLDIDIMAQTISLLNKEVGYPEYYVEERARGLTPENFIKFVEQNDRSVIDEFIVHRPIHLYHSECLPAAVELGVLPRGLDRISAVGHSITMGSASTFRALLSHVLTPKYTLETYGDGRLIWNLLQSAKTQKYSETQQGMVNELIEKSAQAMSAFIKPEKFIEFIRKGPVSVNSLPFVPHKLFENAPILELLKADIWPWTPETTTGVFKRIVESQDQASFDMLIGKMEPEPQVHQTFLGQLSKLVAKLKKQSNTNSYTDVQLAMVTRLEKWSSELSNDNRFGGFGFERMEKELKLFDGIRKAFNDGDIESVKSSIEQIKADPLILTSPGLLGFFSHFQEDAFNKARHEGLTDEHKAGLNLIKDLMTAAVAGMCQSIVDTPKREKKYPSFDFDSM
jgi:hypothetical protein